MYKKILFFFLTGLLLFGHTRIPFSRETDKPDKKSAVVTKKKRKRKKKGLFEKILPKRDLYIHKKKEDEHETGASNLETEANVSSIKRNASDELNNIMVLLSEIPVSDKKPIVAPIFMTDQKNIFGTITDLSFRWVGYKLQLKFKQNKFPWHNTSLEEHIIGSFLYASGTNLGFINKAYREETRFYTNYSSQIVILRWNIIKYITTGYGLGSRQYFFVEKETPDGFTMPDNHINIFPRFILDFGYITEKGIDQLTKGIKFSSWVGYGLRSKWDSWGTKNNLESGNRARDFVIYSTSLTAGILFLENHNIVLRGKYKGGLDNDFLSRPRFGATIDNAKLDVVHGFTLDEFRVFRFGLINLKYGFNIFKRLRLNLFLDYAHIFSPEKKDYFGSGYGIRIKAIYGLPIWITHGIGRKLNDSSSSLSQVIMIMTAIGW